MAKTRKQAESGPDWEVVRKASRLERRTVKTGVYLSEDGDRRLKTAALVLGLDRSVIMDALLRHALVGFYAGWRKGEDSEDLPSGQDLGAQSLPAA